MSKIQQIKQNYQPQYSNAKNNSYNGIKHSPNFKGLSKADEILIHNTIIKDYLKLPGRFLDYLARTAGEMQNLAIIGIGTAFVAPIFIAFNPFSKEDPNSKKYSAWRQPISAVIATATSMAVNDRVANWVDNKMAEGKLTKFDMSAKPSSDLLKKKYNSIIKNFNNMKESDKKYFDMVKEKGIESVEDFKIKFTNFQEFEKAVHKVTLTTAANKLLDVNNSNGLRNTTVKDFLIKNMNFEADAIDDKMLNPDIVKSKLKDTTAIAFLRKFGFGEDKVKEDSLRAFINENFYKEKFMEEMKMEKPQAEKLFNVIKELADKNNLKIENSEELENLFINKLSKQGFDSSQRKTITRLAEMLISEKAKNEETISLKNLLKVLGLEENFHKNDDILNMKVDEFLLWMDKKLDIKGALNAPKRKAPTVTEAIKNECDNGKLLKFAKQIAEDTVKKAQSNFKAYKFLQGIILSLAVLPFACGALNWSYPRIMEKVFPKLSASKTKAKAEEKGGK